MELEFELDNNQLLVLDVYFETDTMTGEAWGAPFTHTVQGYEINSATLYSFTDLGDEQSVEEDVNPYQYISDDDIMNHFE